MGSVPDLPTTAIHLTSIERSRKRGIAGLAFAFVAGRFLWDFTLAIDHAVPAVDLSSVSRNIHS